MKLVALTFTRIDGDVIEEFLRYTARFVDHHIVGIMGATDDSRAIVDALIAEGLPITIWRLSDSVSVEGDPAMTEPFARAIFERYDCDYLLPIDADEFVVADSREHLLAALEALPPGAHASVPWSTYVPSGDDDPTETRVLARIRHRRTSEAHAFSKVFVNRSFASDPQATIIAGNHLIDGARDVTVALSDIRLAHFPVRSLQQIQSKALVGSSAILTTGYGDRSALGYQWQLAFERLFGGSKDGAPADLGRLAATYLGDAPSDAEHSEQLVYDPLPSVPRAYAMAGPGLLEVSVGLSLQIARTYGDLRNTIMPPAINPAGQWPRFNAALGRLDAFAVTDARGKACDGIGAMPVGGSGAHIELHGWIAFPNALAIAERVYAIFPGKRIALRVGDAATAERSPFSGRIDLHDFQDGVYIVRIFTVTEDGQWFALRETATFEKRA